MYQEEGDLDLDLTKKKKKRVDKVDEQEDSEREYTYTELLEKLFSNLTNTNTSKKNIPIPRVERVGTKKTLLLNFGDICRSIYRSPEHVKDFLLSELNTVGSIDSKEGFLVKGRFVSKHFEALIRNYIEHYVSCATCRKMNTILIRDSNTRLYFLECNDCGSKRSVQQIKAGFHATNRGDRGKMKNQNA